MASLLDHVEDRHGARQADYCLKSSRWLMNWYAARHDDYSPPIVRGDAAAEPRTRRRAPASSATTSSARSGKQRGCRPLRRPRAPMPAHGAASHQGHDRMQWSDIDPVTSGPSREPRAGIRRDAGAARRWRSPSSGGSLAWADNPHVFAGRAGRPDQRHVEGEDQARQGERRHRLADP